jgi:hypothetical protein
VLVPVLASIGSLYDRAIVDTGREAEFLFFVAFLVTFGFIRTSAHLIRAQVSWWPGNVNVGGTHIHHLVCPPSPWHEILAVLFGVGTGLTLDEFALWLNLQDVYWSDKGRRSIDAVIITATVTGMILVGFTAWIDVADTVAGVVFAIVGFFGGLGIAFAAVNLAKEKFAVALAGLLFPPVGLVGSFRLAKPHSLWARLFYGEEKRARARERFGDAPPQERPHAAQPEPKQPAALR